MYYTSIYHSPIGQLTLLSDGTHLLGLWIEGQTHFNAKLADDSIHDDTLPLWGEVRRWLDGYFARETPTPDHLPLKPAGTEFQRKVWKILAEIPYGATVSYAQIAKEIAVSMGKSRMSAQAVGNAVGRNPISIIIPCHRVIGASGDLIGYNGGIELKKWLLRHEGHDIP